MSRAIVLSSEGRHFCAGLDFATSSTADIPSLYGAALRLFTAPLPVVAAVQGAAIGGGCGLALSADFRVAAHEARFCTNFARIGFHHGFALSATLPAAVGQQAAADLLLTGRRVPGDEALVMGLCDRLVAGDELIAAAISYATELAEGAPLAVRAIRATLRRRLVEDAASRARTGMHPATGPQQDGGLRRGCAGRRRTSTSAISWSVTHSLRSWVVRPRTLALCPLEKSRT